MQELFFTFQTVLCLPTRYIYQIAVDLLDWQTTFGFSF